MAVRYTSRKDPIDNKVPLPGTEKAIIFVATMPASQGILSARPQSLVLILVSTRSSADHVLGLDLACAESPFEALMRQEAPYSSFE